MEQTFAYSVKEFNDAVGGNKIHVDLIKNESKPTVTFDSKYRPIYVPGVLLDQIISNLSEWKVKIDKFINCNPQLILVEIQIVGIFNKFYLDSKNMFTLISSIMK